MEVLKELKYKIKKKWKTIGSYSIEIKLPNREILYINADDIGQIWFPDDISDGNLHSTLRQYLDILNEKGGSVVCTAKRKGDEYYIYHYKDKFYSSELGLSIEDVKKIVDSSIRKREDSLMRELERIRAQEEMEGATRQSISSDVKVLVWNRDGGKCVECGSNENLEFDHIIPVSKGGSNTARNIQLLCEKCNRSKGARII